MSAEHDTAAGHFQLPTRQELRELRLVAGLNVTEVADRGGWAASTVHRWEQGDQDPVMSNVRQLLEIYREEFENR